MAPSAVTTPRLADARAYCRRLARRHYENFSVATWLLPATLRPHFYAVYAYCRGADDLADEIDDAATSLERLDAWEDQLEACYADRPRHPVFVALTETIRQFDIPRDPFLDLLVAFRRDQKTVRYESMDQLLDYCRYSANPVGRLVLYLGRCHGPNQVELADSISTGLQLANFWQDVARDADRGRCYLPDSLCREHGYTRAMLARRETNTPFRRLLRTLVDRTEEFLRRGQPLVRRVPEPLRVDVSLFSLGGLAVLEGIRRIDYDVWRTRPVVGRMAKLRLLAGAWWRCRREVSIHGEDRGETTRTTNEHE